MRSAHEHVIPGLGYLAVGTWWLINVFCRHLQCKGLKPSVYTNVCFYATKGGLPIDLILIAGVCVLQIWMEVLLLGRAPFPSIANHITIAMCFSLAAVISLINYKMQMFPRCEYILLAFAMTIEAVTFAHHKHTSPSADWQHLESTIHWLLLLSSLAMVAALLMEMYQLHSVLVGLTRAFLFVVHGFWYIFAGIGLYTQAFGNWWLHRVREDVSATELEMVTCFCISNILGIIYAAGCLVASHWLITVIGNNF